MNIKEKLLIEDISKKHDISSHTLQFLLIQANDYSYENKSQNERINSYYEIIKYGIKQNKNR